jgi:hypothetical protein
MRILVILPDRFRQDISSVNSTYARGRIKAETLVYEPRVNPLKLAVRHAAGCDAVMVAGDQSRAPATMVEGPFLPLQNGRRVPVGWLPLAGRESLHRILHTIERVHSRPRGPVSLAVLSQRSPRYLAVAGRVFSVLSRHRGILVYQWTAERVLKEAMVHGVRTGIGCAMYVGHGRPIGWVGYYGTRIHDFTGTGGEPAGAILSLCCETASRKRTGLSFSESLVTCGVAAASFGAARKTFHIGNTRWAVNVCEALRQGVSSLGELLVRACPPQESSWRNYRIIGDPLAPLQGWAGAAKRARKIEVYV